MGLKLEDKAALRRALEGVARDAAETGEEGEGRCGPDLSDAELLQCEQRRYAAMYEGCGVGCVRALSRFIEPDLKAAGYAPGWPLPASRHRVHRHRDRD